MFGLLDSVKQAVELKRCHKDRQNRSHHHDTGETAAVQTDVRTDVPGLLMDASLAFQCWVRFWRTGRQRPKTKAPPAKWSPWNTSDLSANPALWSKTSPSPGGHLMPSWTSTLGFLPVYLPPMASVTTAEGAGGTRGSTTPFWRGSWARWWTRRRSPGSSRPWGASERQRPARPEVRVIPKGSFLGERGVKVSEKSSEMTSDWEDVTETWRQTI